jgi:hypothetical protein
VDYRVKEAEVAQGAPVSDGLAVASRAQGGWWLWRRVLSVRSGMRRWRALGPGLRTASGGGMAVSGVIEEQALSGFEKLLSVVRERAWGLKF